MRLVKYLVAALLVISITKKVHVAPNDITPDQNIKYDNSTKTALLKTTCEEMYVGVVEYNQSVTPPNITIPALKLFAKIPTPNYHHSSKHKPILGGLNPTTSLYGIPVTGFKYHIKAENNTVGYYWPTNKIVQLDNGQVLVGIQEKTEGNYINLFTRKPRLSESEKQELLKLYNVTVTDQSLKNIGKIRKDNKNIVLYGIFLNNHPSFTNFKD